MKAVVFDLEANGLLETATQVWCGVFKDLTTREVTKFTPDKIQEMLKYMDQYDTYIGHNIAGYDFPLLKKLLGYTIPPEKKVIDTWLLSMMVEPDLKRHPLLSKKKGPHSLENWGYYLGRHKPEHEEWDVFSDEMLNRCSEDVEINHRVYLRLLPKSGPFLKKPMRIETAFSAILTDMASTGFLTDRNLLLKHIEHLDTLMQEIADKVVPKLPKAIIIHEGKEVDGTYKWNKKPFKGNGDLNKYTSDWCIHNDIQDSSIIGGPFTRVEFRPFDIGSVQKVKDYLLEQGWVPEKWNTKKDPITGEERRTSPKISKDEEFLGVKGEEASQIALRLIYRHRKSTLEGLDKLIRHDGRIAARATGITPTVRLKHAGIVNIPGEEAIFGKEMREVFIARPGYKINGCDAKSCQLRLLCHHMGDPDYTYAVVNGNKDDGTDIHSLNMEATGIGSRRVAKNFIYGFLFGAGVTKLGTMLGGGLREGKVIKEQFLDRFPKLRALIEGLESFFDKHGYIIGADGRHIYPRSKHQILCYQLQSDEAILMKVATIFTIKEIKKRGLDSQLVVHMHDEYQFETLEAHADEVAVIQAESISKAGTFLNFSVPMEGDSKIGNSWWETH